MDYEYLKNAHYNLFYMYTKEEINQIYKNTVVGAAIIGLGLKYLASFFLSLLCIPWSLKSLFPRHKNRILFFCATKNNLDALKPISKLLKSDALLITNNYRLRKDALLLFLLIPYLLSFFNIPKFVIFYLRASNLERRIFLSFSPQILFSMGYYHFCRFYLRLMMPKCIVFSNDHIYHSRMLVSLAENTGIRCFYVQHASVADGFPKLFSSYALLEGQHAREKYLAVGSNENKITLIGMTKLDEFINQVNRNSIVRKIGICTTRSMDFEETCEMISFIKENFASITLILRTHPNNESQEKYKAVINSHGLEISNARTDNIFSYLADVDAVISGNSSVLLEAALLDVFPIYYGSSKTRFFYKHDRYDKFDYVKNKVAYPVNNLESLAEILVKLLKHKPSVRKYTQFYCDTIGTVYEGKSAALAAQFINEHCGLNPSGI